MGICRLLPGYDPLSQEFNLKLRTVIVVAAAAAGFSSLGAQAAATTLRSSTFDSQSTVNGQSSFSGIA